MKKVIIIAAGTLIAFASQAASFKWAGVNIYDHTGTSTYTGTAAIYAYLSTETVADAVMVKGDVAINAGAMATTYDWTGASVGSTYQFYMVITDGDYTFNSSVSTPEVIKSGIAGATSTTTTLAFGNMASSTQNAGNWAAVPEPTSGLLMLLGMAGLALRRRRA